jgi:hypothetical protein
MKKESQILEDVWSSTVNCKIGYVVRYEDDSIPYDRYDLENKLVERYTKYNIDSAEKEIKEKFKDWYMKEYMISEDERGTVTDYYFFVTKENLYNLELSENYSNNVDLAYVRYDYNWNFKGIYIQGMLENFIQDINLVNENLLVNLKDEYKNFENKSIIIKLFGDKSIYILYSKELL